MEELYKQQFDEEGRPKERPKVSLNEQMSRLTDTMENLMISKGTAKKFKLPMKGRINKSKVKKKFASICYINENKGVKFLRVPINEGVLMIDGTPHLATPDVIMNYKNKPFLIVPAWSTKPFSPEINYDETMKEGFSSHGYKLLLNTMKKDALKALKKGGGMMILIIVAVAIGGYYLYTSGAFGG